MRPHQPEVDKDRSPGRRRKLILFLIALLCITLIVFAPDLLTTNLDEVRSAAYNGHALRIRLMLMQQPELAHAATPINPDDDYVQGVTPLHYAASGGHIDVAKILIAHGADVNAEDEAGFRPVRGASKFGHEQVVELLVANGAEVNVHDFNGDTPLHYAVHNGHTSIVKLLLAEGADVNARNNSGETPLHEAAGMAAYEQHRGIIDVRMDTSEWPTDWVDLTELLLEHGADKNLESGGLTPLEFAQDHGSKGVARLLKKHDRAVSEQQNR